MAVLFWFEAVQTLTINGSVLLVLIDVLTLTYYLLIVLFVHKLVMSVISL